MTEEIILVDANDRQVGIGGKLETHAQGKLHRAFSIFVFDSKERLLLQKRAKTKYHSANLWSNTCCGHPRPHESTLAAAHRRLREEMNIACPLREIFSFIYKVEFDNDLFEHEYDHVFAGTFDGRPAPCALEVDDWKWIEMDDLRRELRERPGEYTHWLGLAVEKLTANEISATRPQSLPDTTPP